MAGPTRPSANEGVIELANGAVVEFVDGPTGGGTIAFVGSGGVLQIDGTTMPVDTIAGVGRRRRDRPAGIALEPDEFREF